MAGIEVTENELVAALRQAQAIASDDDGAMTTRELRKMLGWGDERVREHLRSLRDEGRLELVKAWREQLDGVMRRTTAYRLIDNRAREAQLAEG